MFAHSFVRSFVCLFIHDSVPFVELLQSFTLKFLKWGVSQQPPRKHSYLDHRYPGGSAFISWLVTPGSMPQRSKSRTPFFFSTFLLWKQLMQIVGQTWLNFVTWTCGSWSEGQHDLYFTVQWFWLISWRLFDVCTSYFQSMNQYNMTFDLKINEVTVTYISWSSDSALYLEDYFMYEHHYLGLWTYISWSSDCALYLQDYFMYEHHCFGIMNQYDPTHHLKINVCHCDLYFMGQWFCLISQTIWWMSVIFLGNESVTQLWPKINIHFIV